MERLSTTALGLKKRAKEKIVWTTCYDATFARLVEGAGIDAVLVGDSLGMVIQGHEHTLPVTLDEMIYHTRAVARSTRRVHLVADLPFGTYQSGPDVALRSAVRLLKEGGAQAVKLEGGGAISHTIRVLVDAGIPVVGHLGLTPQSVHQLGGFRVQARDEEAATRLLRDAREIEEAGAYALVLEGIPAQLSSQVTSALSIPTVGIGAGPHCDGQILVLYDLLGLDERFSPKFLKKYEDLNSRVVQALRSYKDEVRGGDFPAASHSH
ncbi:MAG: 3-methyl-2-oxobutanoate hydroxymethyltransferase [Myxococcota bacterium]|nr:3-methyl-2-oxobutanoate hydroxymethyltransferase [Myxococcota bacterium]